jgi:uncharacterized protein
MRHAVSLSRKRLHVRIAAIILASFLMVYSGLSVFGALAAMEIPRQPVRGSPALVGLVYQDVAFQSRTDDLLLKGWYIPGKKAKVIIIINGGFQNRIDDNVDTLDLANDLHQKGFDILLFDLRGRGESQGHGVNLSNIDADIGGAFDYVESRGYFPESIGILGFCSGAASACIFASHQNVGALVLDGCFSSVQNMIYTQAQERHIPSALVDIFLPGLRLGAFLLFGYRELDPIQVVGDIKSPILLIFEQKDDLTTLTDNELLLKASPNPDNGLWEIAGALHSQGYRADPVEYCIRVSDFFSSNLIERTS